MVYSRSITKNTRHGSNSKLQKILLPSLKYTLYSVLWSAFYMTKNQVNYISVIYLNKIRIPKRFVLIVGGFSVTFSWQWRDAVHCLLWFATVQYRGSSLTFRRNPVFRLKSRMCIQDTAKELLHYSSSYQQNWHSWYA